MSSPTTDHTLYQLMECARELLPLTETEEGRAILARDSDKFFPAVMALLLAAQRVRRQIDSQSVSRLKRAG